MASGERAIPAGAPCEPATSVGEPAGRVSLYTAPSGAPGWSVPPVVQKTSSASSASAAAIPGCASTEARVRTDAFRSLVLTDRRMPSKLVQYKAVAARTSPEGAGSASATRTVHTPSTQSPWHTTPQPPQLSGSPASDVSQPSETS